MLGMQKKLTNFFYVILSFPATAMGFALSIQIAALSWIMNTQYGLDIHEVGIVWAAGPLAGIFGQIIIGLMYLAPLAAVAGDSETGRGERR